MAVAKAITPADWAACGDVADMIRRLPMRTQHGPGKVAHLMAAFLRLANHEVAPSLAAGVDDLPLWRFSATGLEGAVRAWRASQVKRERESERATGRVLGGTGYGHWTNVVATLLNGELRADDLRSLTAWVENSLGYTPHFTRLGRRAGDGLSKCTNAAHLVRDVYPSPRGLPSPPPLAAEWMTGTVAALANHAWVERDYSSLPILADALQDAGCEREDVLGHLRSGLPHCRGCWVLNDVVGQCGVAKSAQDEREFEVLLACIGTGTGKDADEAGRDRLADWLDARPPSPVDRSLPRIEWLRRAWLRTAWGRDGTAPRGVVGWEMIYSDIQEFANATRTSRVFDHDGVTELYGRKCIATEPYGEFEKSRKALRSVADLVGCVDVACRRSSHGMHLERNAKSSVQLMRILLIPREKTKAR